MARTTRLRKTLAMALLTLCLAVLGAAASVLLPGLRSVRHSTGRAEPAARSPKPEHSVVRTPPELAERAARIVETSGREYAGPPPADPAATGNAPESDSRLAESQIIQYRETHIRRRAFGETEWFAIVGSPTIYETLYAAKLAVNRQKLTAASRLSDEALLQRFIDADRNRDSFLDWDEISLFQLELCEEFEYQHNDIALPPHHFLALGGGDCEDWALVTAALLRFWGIESLIASVKEDADESPHAITLMRSSSPPEDFGRIHLHESMLRHVPNATPGLYVPIDYHFVGSVSPAVGPNYRYLWVDRPEFLYDLGL